MSAQDHCGPPVQDLKVLGVPPANRTLNTWRRRRGVWPSQRQLVPDVSPPRMVRPAARGGLYLVLVPSCNL